MQAADLVAIIRTSGGIGVLQQFTSDRRHLYAAIEQIKSDAGGRTEAGAFAPIGPSTSGKFGDEFDKQNKELEEFRSACFLLALLERLAMWSEV